MTVRTDITVNFNLNPRLIKVASPSTAVSMQDLVDTVRSIEDDFGSMDNDHLLNAAGKEDLGGGVSVGITVELQDAQIEFEARTAATSAGTATSVGTTILTDTAATFIADGVLRGAIVINFTDHAVATVLTVDSETQITHTAFTGGTANDWSITDDYRVTNEIQCEASGGNLTAVDSLGASMPSLFPSIGTQIVRSSSSSATLSGLEIANLQRVVESLRKSHSGYGDIYYWDSNSGNDNNDGLSPETGKKTFAAAQDLAVDYHNDIIFAVPRNTTGATVSTEPIRITVPQLFLRGPGRLFHIEASSAIQPAVWINAVGCSIEGFNIQQTNAAQPGLLMDKENILIKNIIVRQCAANGIEQTVTGGNLPNKPVTVYENVETIQNVGFGLQIHDNVGLTFIRDFCHFEENGLDGACLDTNVDDVHFIQPIFHENARYGLNIADSTVFNTAVIDPHYINNDVGDFVDNGSSTVVIEKETTDIKKALLNQMITDPVTGLVTIYDNDNTTVLFQGTVKEDAAGATAYNSTSTKIDRRNRMT